MNRHGSAASICALVLIVSGGVTTRAFASAIDLETLIGPSTFDAAGNATTVTTSTAIGDVTLNGGVILTNATNAPADETSIYGTAGNSSDLGVFPGAGFLNPLTVTFPAPVTNVFLDVLNGNIIDVTYLLSDNAGHSAAFTLPPNLSSGQKTIGFAATGSMVTVAAITGQSTASGLTWDFFVDNIHFNEDLPPGLGGPAAVPEPSTVALTAAGLFGLWRYRKTSRRRCGA